MKQNHMYHFWHDLKLYPWWSGHDRQDEAWYPSIRDRYTQDQKRRSNGKYLAGVPIFSITLIGRWSSTAFLKYIWKQVQKFSHGISSKLSEVQSFKHIWNSTTTNPMASIVGNLYLLLMGRILLEEASLPKNRELGPNPSCLTIS